MSEKPTLGYWNFGARADPIRTLLHHLEVDFEDKQYTFGDDTSPDSWAMTKPNLGIHFPNLPYWKDGDMFHSEMLPICRTICRKYKPEYLGRTMSEQVYVDSYMDSIMSQTLEWFIPNFFLPDYNEKREEGTEKAKTLLDNYCKLLGNNKYLVGNDITYADFIFEWVIRSYRCYDERLVNEFPKLVSYLESFSALAGVAAAKQASEGMLLYSPACGWMSDNMPA